MSVSEHTYCIFQQPWWLEAVAPGEWDEVILKKGGQIEARLPYIKKKKWGLTFSFMPPFTQVLGPWIQPLEGKYASRLSRERKILKKLAERLPSFDYFDQGFHYNITNWLPLYWQGYEQTTRYTYVLNQIDDFEYIWGELKGNIRREIKKARDNLAITTDLGIHELWRLHQLTFERQNTRPTHSFETFKRLHQACSDRNAGQSFFAVDDRQRTHAAVYIIWDHHSAYYLMGGADPELRNSGASSLLMWKAIKFASDKTQCFDFEGSMIESIERFFRGFGARQKRYFRITGFSKKGKLLNLGREFLRTLLSRNN